MSLVLPLEDVDINVHPSKEYVALVHEVRVANMMRQHIEQKLLQMRGEAPPPAAVPATASPNVAIKSGKRPFEKDKGKSAKGSPVKKVRATRFMQHCI